MGSKRKRSVQEMPAAAPAAKKIQKSSPNTTSKRAPSPTPLDTSPFLDNPKGADLKREVQLYDLLSSEDSTQRLNAAGAVVSGLLSGDGVEESTLQRHLERRLFRGLASGRKGARLGFSVVLTELLGELFGQTNLAEKKYAGLTFDKVLEILVAKTKPDGDLSGQEEKDHALGLLFGLQCFVRSKTLFASHDRWDPVFQKLLALSDKKPWIREECGWIMVEALGWMQQKQAEATLEKLYEAGLASSPEGVGIWITAKTRFPEIKFPKKPWGKNGNPLDHLKELAKALKESSSNDDAEKGQQAKQTGNWNPRLHFVWNIVLAQYAEATKSKTESDFGNFWKVAVDENLFSATASRERKFWGFLLFQKMIQDFASHKNLLRKIFSHNLVRCLINHVQEKDRFLHRAADKSLKVLIHGVEANPSILPIVLSGLVDGNGTYNFDKVTKTKTIEKLLAMVNDSNAKRVAEILYEPIKEIKSLDLEKDSEMRRRVFGDYILNMIRRVEPNNSAKNAPWIADTALIRLSELAYSKGSFQPAISESTRSLFRNRLMSAFSHLLSDLEGCFYPCDLVLSCNPDAVAMDEGIADAKDRAVATLEELLEQLKDVDKRDKAPFQALSVLYSLVIFQLYNGEPEAVSILDDLHECYDKLILGPKSTDAAKGNEAESDYEDPVQILVELLLSLISRPSALLRKVAQHVFNAFIGEMTAGGLKLLTDILEKSENLRGQQEVFDQEDGDEMDVDDEEEDDEEDELDSDVEVVDMNGQDGGLNPHLQEEESEEEDEEEENDASEDDEEARKLDDALAKALGTHRLDQDLNAEESDSDADMSDSEMMELDSKLVEIFSQRKKIPNKKQEQKDAKENMVNFKGRVLDLLDIYVKKQASNPLAFDLLLPLLQLIRTTKTKQLAGKSHDIILSFGKSAKKSAAQAEIDVFKQLELLKAIHAEASEDPSHAYAKAASTAGLLVASSLYRTDKGKMEEIANVYRDSQVKWVNGEVKMQASFFMEWVNWCQSHASTAGT